MPKAGTELNHFFSVLPIAFYSLWLSISKGSISAYNTKVMLHKHDVVYRYHRW